MAELNCDVILRSDFPLKAETISGQVLERRRIFKSLHTLGHRLALSTDKTEQSRVSLSNDDTAYAERRRLGDFCFQPGLTTTKILITRKW